MWPSSRLLRLSRWGTEPETVLADALDGMRMQDDGGWQEISPGEALARLDDGGHHLVWELRRFATDARLSDSPLSRVDDHQLLSIVRGLIRSRRLVGLRHVKDAVANSETASLRRLVAQIRKATRGKLSYQGRQYQLVVDIDLGRTPNRDSYEVASQVEALAVLDRAAEESHAPADLLRQARSKISKDWHASYSEPDGLVLLRWVPARAAATRDEGATITPSQMKALLPKDWIEIEVVDQDGEPCPAHYRLELANSDVREGELDQEGGLSVAEVEPGNCKLTLGGAMPASSAGETSA